MARTKQKARKNTTPRGQKMRTHQSNNTGPKFAKAAISSIQYSSLLNIVAFAIGDILYSLNLKDNKIYEIAQHENINSLTFTNDSTAIVSTSSSAKTFRVWRKPVDINEKWTMEKEVTTKLKILESTLTKDDKSIILTDKNGDVFIYHLDGSNNNTAEEAGEEKNLLLGHFSAITDTQFSPCFNYLLTADRDEKIRVSSYPNTFDIHNFCLGHTLFVSKFIFNPSKPDIIVSGSGDGTVKVWDWKNGQVLQSLDLKKEGQSHDEVITSPLAFIGNTLYLAIEGEKFLYPFEFNAATNLLVNMPAIELPAQPLSYATVVGSKLLIPAFTVQLDSPLLLAFDNASQSIDTQLTENINQLDVSAMKELGRLNALLKYQYKKYLTLNRKDRDDGEGEGEGEEEEEDLKEENDNDNVPEAEKEENALKLRKMTVEGAKEQTK